MRSPILNSRRTLERLYLTQLWGAARCEARSYGVGDAPVIAAPREDAPFPMYGFTISGTAHTLARWDGRLFRVYPPPNVRSSRPADGTDEHGSYVALEPGSSLVFEEGPHRLSVRSGQEARVAPDYARAVFWLTVMIAASLGGPLAFLLAKPDPELPQRALEEARAKQGITPDLEREVRTIIERELARDASVPSD